MRVLVTYGTKLGGTAGIASMIGARLQAAGFEVVVAPAAEMVEPTGFNAVVIGGALYSNRWSRESRRYVKKYGEELRKRPVWLFSSGPLDDSALAGGIPPVPHVVDAMKRCHARDHVTFGGRLESDAEGILAGAMAKAMAGDWRNAEQIGAWGDGIVETLRRNQAA